MLDEVTVTVPQLSQTAAVSTEGRPADADGMESVERVLEELAAPEATGSVERDTDEALREATEDDESAAPAREPVSPTEVEETGESEIATPREAGREWPAQAEDATRRQTEAASLYRSVQSALSDADGLPLASLETSPETAGVRQLWSQGVELWEQGNADAGLAYMRQAERMAQTVGRHVERMGTQAALQQAWREGREALRAAKQEMGMLDLDVEGATAGNLSDDAFWDAFGRGEVHDMDRALDVARKQGLSF